MSVLSPIHTLARIALVSALMFSGLRLVLPVVLLVVLLGAMGIPPSELPSLARLVFDHFTH